jgi:hypothetical protein
VSGPPAGRSPRAAHASFERRPRPRFGAPPVLLRPPGLSTRWGDNLPEPSISHRRFLRVKDDYDRALAALPGCVR